MVFSIMKKLIFHHLSFIVSSKSKTFLTFCFCFLIGVVVGSITEWHVSFWWMYMAALTLVPFFIVFWKNKPARFVLFILAFLFFGFTRSVIAFPLDDVGHIRSQNDRHVTLIGYVAEEPDVRIDSVRYIVQVQNLKLGMQHEHVSGRVYVKTDLYPRHAFGDMLELECDLRRPEPIEDFRYDMYLAKSRVFSVCMNPKVQGYITEGDMEEGTVKNNIQYPISPPKADPSMADNILFSSRVRLAILNPIFLFKNNVADRINRLWHEPHASFMAGLLYGSRGGLGELQELFNITGVSHIIAISGYNISIVATLLMIFFIRLWIPRKKAFWVVVIGILVFIIFTGASASVFRAGIMGIVVLLAKQMGRVSRSLNVIACTAVVMALQNPLVLLWDAGFQLSFAATVGLIYLPQIFFKWFSWIPESFGLRESALSTIAATAATLPLLLYQFGRLSIVSVFVNLLILWIIPWLMLLGFLAVMASFLFYPIAQVIAWIGWVGLSYIILIVKAFANIPFASVSVSFPFWAMVMAYVALVYWMYRTSKILNSKM